jgi:hypothetical protein
VAGVRRAELQPVARLKNHPIDACAIHVSSMRAVQVQKFEAPIVAVDDGVTAGDEAITQNNVLIGQAADGYGLAIQQDSVFTLQVRVGEHRRVFGKAHHGHRILSPHGISECVSAAAIEVQCNLPAKAIALSPLRLVVNQSFSRLLVLQTDRHSFPASGGKKTRQKRPK